jgi:hypothetical protein
MAPSAALPLSGGAGNKLHGLFQRHPGNPKINFKKIFSRPEKIFSQRQKKIFYHPIFYIGTCPLSTSQSGIKPRLRRYLFRFLVDIVQNPLFKKLRCFG